MENPKNSGFRVIIVGGSIAGLTLAHSLHHAGIDYIVLEARDTIDPQVGASIGIFSNGARILDQLGVYDDIERETDAPVWNEMVTGEGVVIQRVDSLQLIEARMGYPVAFLERQRVLKILYDRFPDVSRVLTGKKVVSVDHGADGVRVHCEDGSEFTGDIVAGADGVHSRVRREMWRYAERENGLKQLSKDKKAMFAEYRCLFGISSPVAGLEEKAQYRAFNKDWSFLVVVGKGGRCFWFVFEKLDQIYQPPNMPRYTESDQLEFVKPFMKRYVSQSVTFDAVWERKTAATLTVLEEAQYQHWTYGRFVCLGDAIHKMTPNIGQGGNWAIESAAALANHLYTLNSHTTHPSLADIQVALSAYEKARKPRTKEVSDTAGMATRLEAFASFHHKLLFLYVVPYAGDMLVDVHCQSVAGAPRLDYLSLPDKSLRGGMPFESAKASSQRESPLRRLIYALPLIGLVFAAYLALGNPFRTGPGRSTAIFRDIDTVLPHLDQVTTTERLQTIEFMGDLAPLLIIGIIESLRRGHSFTFASLWPLFALVGQWKGTAFAVPLYYFFHYMQSPLDRCAAPDNRLVPTNYAKTLVAAVGIGYILPTLYLFLGWGRHSISTVWQASPLLLAVLHRAFASSLTDTTANDRIKSPRADVKSLRWAYAIGGIFAGIVHLYVRVKTPGYFYQPPSYLSLHDLVASGAVEDLGRIKYNHLVTASSALFWQLLNFRDLKRTERLKASWAKIIALFLGTSFLFGPGASTALGWAWREEVLAGTLNGGY